LYGGAWIYMLPFVPHFILYIVLIAQKCKIFLWKIFLVVVFQTHGGRLRRTWCRKFLHKKYKIWCVLWCIGPDLFNKNNNLDKKNAMLH
jgi:hypothetical protein